MRTSTVFFVLASVLAVNASVIHDGGALLTRHAHLNHRGLSGSMPLIKRCRPRNYDPNNVGSLPAPLAPSTPAPAPSPPAPSPPPPPPQEQAPQGGNDNGGSNNGNSGGSNGGGNWGGGGVINVQSSCGNIGATAETTHTTGPNGSLDWLNCGIESGGWTPPYIRIQDLVVKNLQEVVNSGNSPFTACSDFIGLFEHYGNQYGIPPIMLASFAMQESSCNPWTVGGGGEQGLMQLTHDKCGGAPNGNCQDPDFNIRTGAAFFAGLLASHNGDVLISIGRYNGWFPGITIVSAFARFGHLYIDLGS
ncbi:hypothetical protein AX16_005194 [Volvariella volvacea WC 439]|nr:hypothetical protein AX16_005194 [Volvariella volvacea WC 439]